VLILGGTGEAKDLLRRLHALDHLDVVSSLAGRLRHPKLPDGQVRVGGFGGPDGLAAHLVDARIDVVIDATHPFAVRISDNAVVACRRVGVPLVVLHRPGWSAGDGDRWHRVPTTEDAARWVATGPPGVVLLTLGRRVSAFATDPGHHYLVRSIDPPDGELPPSATVLSSRGPFTMDDELALFREHAVSVLVTKDSGGPATAGKLLAARDLGLPVVMVDRPPTPRGIPLVTTVDQLLRWLNPQPRPRSTDGAQPASLPGRLHGLGVVPAPDPVDGLVRGEPVEDGERGQGCPGPTDAAQAGGLDPLAGVRPTMGLAECVQRICPVQGGGR
jgi:precorrin-6A/cobalt-precorrin-6A reductase